MAASRIVVALDAMGGDHAPAAIVAGAEIARVRFPDADFQFYGDEAKIAPLLAPLAALKARARIVHTSEIVSADDKPAVALRQRRQSSMRLAIDAVAAGEAACVVSGGNTGALMAIARMVLKTLPGIDRPAIVSIMPTQRGEVVMLDLGANIECEAENLVQFAVMGALFARAVLGIPEPLIGLLNVGEEEQKGHDEVRQAAQLLRERPLPGRFHGFVEGDDIPAGTVDVVVTDGFSGNIALKTAEGTARLISHFLRDALKSSALSMVGAFLAKGALQRLKLRMDPRRYNGAMFLGLQGVCVKSHGGSDAEGVANAIGVAVDLVRDGILPKIVQGSAALAAPDSPASSAAGA